MLGLVRQIRECLESAFKSAYNYADTLEPLVDFYAENEQLDIEVFMDQDPTLEFFSEALKKYHSQHKEQISTLQENGYLVLWVRD